MNQQQQKEHARRMALANGEGHGVMESGSDFDRAGERYFAENPVPQARLAKEYDKQPGGGYTHKAKGSY